MRSGSRRRSQFGKASVAVLAALLGAACSDDLPEWRSLGPYSGTVLTLAFDPSDPEIAYAGTRDGGVFRSVDGGNTWGLATRGLNGSTVNHIVVDPVTRAVYASTQTRGVFRSRNFGYSWRSRDRGLNSDATRTLLIGREAGDLFAGTFGRGIYYSGDRGRNWRLTDDFPDRPSVTSLAALPGTTVAGTDSGLFLFDRDAITWEPGGPPNISVVDLATGPSGELYAAAFGDGILSSSDAGVSWKPEGGQELDPFVSKLAVTEDRLYAGTTSSGVYVLEQGGRAEWQATAAPPPGQITALAAPSTTSVFAAVEYAGLHVSRSGAGDNWQSANRGLGALSITAFARNNADESFTYVGSRHAGGYRARDGNLAWERMNDLPDPEVTALAVHPRRPEVVYAALGNGSLWQSSDDGQHFSPLTSPAAGSSSVVSALAVHASSGSLYAALQSGAVLRSNDDGTTWLPVVTLPPVTKLIADAADPDAFLAATECGLYRGRATETSWARLDDDTHCRQVAAAMTHPEAPDLVYFASSEGFFRSEDGGRSFIASSDQVLNGSALTAMSIGVDDALAVFVGTESGRVLATSDSGRTWQLVGAGSNLPAITALNVDNGNPHTVLAATAGNSIVSREWMPGPSRRWYLLATLTALLALVTLGAGAGRGSPPAG